MAFALDIDGVLLHAKKPIEGAIEALAELGGQSDAWRVPIVFLTNGGGVDEASKARELEHLLQLRAGVHASQVILAHTPFRTLGASRPDETRLVVGRGSTPQVARAYWGPSGDRGIGCDIVTTRDLIRSAGTRMVPFSSHIDFDPRDGARGRIDPMPTLDGIGSVWVFTDPRGDDWYHDLQVVLDITLGRCACLWRGGIQGGARPSALCRATGSPFRQRVSLAPAWSRRVGPLPRARVQIGHGERPRVRMLRQAKPGCVSVGSIVVASPGRRTGLEFVGNAEVGRHHGRGRQLECGHTRCEFGRLGEQSRHDGGRPGGRVARCQGPADVRSPQCFGSRAE